jgi:membrane protease YdiL (CAAX protease family)
MDSAADQSDGFRMAVLVEGGVALFALILAWLFAVPLRDMLPVDTQALGWQIVLGVAATLPMLAMFFWLICSRQPAMRKLREQVDWLMRELFPAGNVGQFALVAVLAGVGEELLFRGVIQSLLGRWTTPLTGLIFASLLFGFAHALSRLYFLLATLIGVYLGAIVLQTNDLIAPMTAHSLYDFLALLYLSRHPLPTPGNSFSENVDRDVTD